ncbi:hypothetical protein GSY69_07210 [Brevibacterium sp. 5221]|uniref:ATP-binding protein n=1 Tax=Brevibacterium rongguiense TaxID=2695267 RepID=A0A6N9H859_9MICO|nr:hypothetical protein [Brevibacterium rongguiense]MYM19762.1 hypothetical protein [Brevibacterium rongguiense]
MKKLTTTLAGIAAAGAGILGLAAVPATAQAGGPQAASIAHVRAAVLPQAEVRSGSKSAKTGTDSADGADDDVVTIGGSGASPDLMALLEAPARAAAGTVTTAAGTVSVSVTRAAAAAGDPAAVAA